jgi:hypothetical protein
MPTFPEWWI